MATDDKRKTIGSVDFEEARERGRIGQEYWQGGYKAAEDDLQFLGGKQWSVTDKAERGPGRITLTINDLGQYTDRIIGDLRQNPTAINVIPADFGSAKAKFVSVGGRKYDGTEVMSGLIRQIEYKCSAKDHYSLGGQHAVESGMGWLRLYSDYADMTSFNQDLRVERIRNRFSVIADPMATEPDHSDQNWLFIGDWMKRKEFEKRHPGKSATPMIDSNESSKAFWGREGYVRVTEYYWRESYEFEIAQLDDGSIITDGDDEITEDEKSEAKRLWELAQAGGRIVRTRKHRSFRVKWAKITYNDTIEGPYTLPGTIIPVAPIIGKRIEGDEDTLHYGIVRFAKEPKQMENFWWSSATERISQMPKSPWVVTATNIADHKDDWDNANRGLKPYLPFTPDPLFPGGPQRSTPPSIPAGEIGMMMTAREMVKGAIGLHDAAIGKDTNKQSGRALMALENSANVGSFVFTDNLRMAVSYIGRAMLEWIPSIYDAERIITIRHENGETDTLRLNEVVDGVLRNDIKQGTYDQDVTTGPAYATLRQQSADAMAQFFQFAPDALPAMMDIFLGAQDWPGSKLMAKRARKMVPPQLLDETELTEDEKEKAQQPAPPDPEQVAIEADINARMAASEASIATSEATKVTAQAKIATAERDVAKSNNDLAISDNKVAETELNTVRGAVEAAQPAAAPTSKAEPAAEPEESDAVTRDEFVAFQDDVRGALTSIIQAIKAIQPPAPVEPTPAPIVPAPAPTPQPIQ